MKCSDFGDVLKVDKWFLQESPAYYRVSNSNSLLNV
jgi:hypothetical protein